MRCFGCTRRSVRGAGAAPTPEPACGRAPPPLGGQACPSPRRRSPAAGRRRSDVNKHPDLQAVAFSFQPRRALSLTPPTQAANPLSVGKAPGQPGQSPGSASCLPCAPSSRQKRLRRGTGVEGAGPFSRGATPEGARPPACCGCPGKVGGEQASGPLKKPRTARGGDS